MFLNSRKIIQEPKYLLSFLQYIEEINIYSRLISKMECYFGVNQK